MFRLVTCVFNVKFSACLFFIRSHLILCCHADIQEIITGVKTIFSDVLMLMKVALHVVIALLYVYHKARNFHGFCGMKFEYCASCVQQPAPTHISSHRQTTNHVPAISYKT